MRVITGGQLFCEAIVRAPIVQGLIILGTITGKVIFWGAIILGAIAQGGQMSRGNYPGGNCPVPISFTNIIYIFRLNYRTSEKLVVLYDFIVFLSMIIIIVKW